MDKIEQQFSRIRDGFESLKREDKDTHNKLLSAFEKVHRDALSIISGERKKLEASEFAHALTALGKVPSNLAPLPTKELDTFVLTNGELLGFQKWEILDIGWFQSLENFLKHFFDRATFNTTPVNIRIPDSVSLAIAGDWGTGNWRSAENKAPSERVGEQIAKCNADYTIHLGDVYYSGDKHQEINNLIDIWPSGNKGSFTLNSNHEMYCGAIPYFEQALKNNKFSLQQGCSYFSLENDNWLILGLDTAYDANPFEFYMNGNLNSDQLEWMKNLTTESKRIMVLSHHLGYDLTGLKKTNVYKQIVEALGQSPDFWYWGHEHNAVAYKPKSSGTSKFYGRCIGHGAIPYGKAEELEGNETIDWYENTSASDPCIPMRVLNGFAFINLDGNVLNEKLIAETGEVRYSNKIL